MKKQSRRKSSSRERTEAVIERPPYRVFVSHATYDKFIAKVLCGMIEAVDPRCVTFRDDRDIDGGEQIPERLLTELAACDECLVLVTPASIERQWVIAEISIAYAFRKRIVPILYHADIGKVFSPIRDNRGYQLDEIDGYLDNLRTRLRQDEQ